MKKTFTKEGVRKYFPRRGNFEDEALQMMARDNVLYSKEPEGEWKPYFPPKDVSSILEEIGDVLSAMKDVDTVYHLAAVSNINHVYEAPLTGERTNSGGTMNVLEAARQSNVNRVILASTVWVYDNCKGKEPLSEDTPLTPPNHLYTSTKIASELYCRNYHQLYSLPYTILRYGIPYGPRARKGTVIPIFLQKALKDQPLTIFGKGNNYRHYIYITDLVKGNVLTLKKTAKNQTYNLDNPEKITVLKIAQTIREITKKDIEIKFLPPRPGEFHGKATSTKKAKTELGWKPTTPFREGLKRYIEWFAASASRRELRA